MLLGSILWYRYRHCVPTADCVHSAAAAGFGALQQLELEVAAAVVKNRYPYVNIFLVIPTKLY